MVAQATPQVAMTIGLDLGDRSSRFCCLNEKGEIEKEGSVAMTKKSMLGKFSMLEVIEFRWRLERIRRG